MFDNIMTKLNNVDSKEQISCLKLFITMLKKSCKFTLKIDFTALFLSVFVHNFILKFHVPIVHCSHGIYYRK